MVNSTHTDRKATHNSTFAIAGVSCSADTFVQGESSGGAKGGERGRKGRILNIKFRRLD